MTGKDLPPFPSWLQDRLPNAEYVAVFPTVLLDIQADHACAMQPQPVAPGKAIEHLRLSYVGDEAVRDKYAARRDAVPEAWRVVLADGNTCAPGAAARVYLTERT